MIEYSGYDRDSEERDERDWELTWDDDDPIVRRLRAMTWAEIPDEVRERCWQDIKSRVNDLGRTDGSPDATRAPEVNCERHGYSRRREPCHTFVPRRLVTGPARQFRSQSPAWAFR